MLRCGQILPTELRDKLLRGQQAHLFSKSALLEAKPWVAGTSPRGTTKRQSTARTRRQSITVSTCWLEVMQMIGTDVRPKKTRELKTM